MEEKINISIKNMSAADSTSSVFTDFCQAWGARFPGSELPDAWEEDVRANLKKHRTKVTILKEELEKEEMYVDYLQTLLKDIERKKSVTRNKEEISHSSKLDADDVDANKQAFLDSHLNELSEKPDAFVTVINVSNINDVIDVDHHPKPLLRPKTEAVVVEALSKNRDSIRSVSSPTTPTSPLISSSTEDFIGREGLAAVNTSSISSSSDSSSKDQPLADLEEDQSNDTGSHRGQPDGRDDEDNSKVTPLKVKLDGVEPNSNRTSSVKDLRANWEGRPPVMLKPMAKSRSKLPLPQQDVLSSQQQPRDPPGRKDSDSSSRGRMGSPSGKSHDSSDSEHSWSRQDSGKKQRGPGGKGSAANAETRLDRLVRKTSGDGKKKPQIKPRIISDPNEPLYDTVAADEDDEVYDNHLLYEKSKTDTIGSGGSTDLGFDEPPLPSRRTGTLSSSDATTISSFKQASEPEEDYVNLQYFLQHRRRANTGDSQTSPLPGMTTITFPSDDELDMDDDEEQSPAMPMVVMQQKPPRVLKRQVTDELPKTPDATSLDVPDVGGRAGSQTASSHDLGMYKCVLQSILDSEAIYLEALSVMLQYMKAMKVTLSTDQPFIPKEDFEVIFYRVPELHELHLTFHDSLKKLVDRWDEAKENVGHTFKMLASRNKIYVAYLNNYQRALESLHRCTEAYPQFADLTRSIKLRSVKGQRQGQSLSLEDLLHKPVSRIQTHCLCLQDLIKYTPKDHPDHKALSDALATSQELVTDYNTKHARELFPHQEQHQRHLVKNSFIVELSEGQRKLRHLFLFNDVLVCAKYKASGGGSHPPTGGVAVGRHQEKFTFQLKWYIPLEHVSGFS